ncbi:MAG: isochorismatase family cysteine hydrolase [Dehalococcoidia bacterium]|nr:isochorismatase family cysteine hydrolase [Dehalococcoidia bacterium]
MPDNPLNVLRPPSPEFFPKRGKTALMVIDMQYFDAHPDWGIGRLAKEKGLEKEAAYFFGQVAGIVPRIQQLLSTCRQDGVEVIFVRIQALTHDCRDMSPSSWARWPRQLLTAKDSKEAQILDELRPREDEIVISKTSSSVFNSTAIDQVLRNLGVEYLIVVGVATHACVELSVRDASDRGYKVFVIGDATATFSENMQRDALQRMNTGLMKVKSTQEMLGLISNMAGEKVRV